MTLFVIPVGVTVDHKREAPDELLSTRLGLLLRLKLKFISL